MLRAQQNKAKKSVDEVRAQTKELESMQQKLLQFREQVEKETKAPGLERYVRDHIKSSGKFAIFTRLKIGPQTPSPLNF